MPCRRDEIFNADYAYFSSYSDSWLAHAKAYVEKMVDQFDLGPDDLVIEIASNDGYLLQYFVEKGNPVLGIEPSGSVAAAAEEKGVRTLVDYFGEALAQKVAAAEKSSVTDRFGQCSGACGPISTISLLGSPRF